MKANHSHQLKNRKIQVLWTLILLVLGFMIAFQYNQVNAIATNPEQQESLSEEALAMRQELLDMQESNAQLEYELAQMKRETSSVEEQIATYEGDLKQLYTELEEARMAAALVAVEGPGLQITVDDSKLAKEVPQEEKNRYLVHVEDLRSIVHDLFLGGAEAIAINGQRLGPVSSLRCIGPVIYINGKSMAPPFVIEAIGSSDGLESAMTLPGGILEAMKNDGLPVNIKKVGQIQLPATTTEVRSVDDLLQKSQIQQEEEEFFDEEIWE